MRNGILAKSFRLSSGFTFTTEVAVTQPPFTLKLASLVVMPVLVAIILVAGCYGRELWGVGYSLRGVGYAPVMLG